MHDPIRLNFHDRYRHALIGLWIAVTLVAIYLFAFHREETQNELRDIMSASLYIAGFIYFTLTALRGFTFMPAAPLIFLGVSFFPPVPLYCLTLAGTVLPTAFIYKYHKALQLAPALNQRHPKMMTKVHDLLHRCQLPVIALWSFLPFTPTNLIVYASSATGVGFRKTMLGVTLGAGTNCAIYIFLGDYLLRVTGFKI